MLETIEPSQIIQHRVVGRGNYGKVYYGLFQDFPVAIKELELHDKDAFQKEIQILR